MVGVSVDTHAQSKNFAEKILAADGRGPLTIPLLSDPQHRIIDAYGVQDLRYLKLKAEGIPLPAAYLIDKSGRVYWASIGSHVSNSEIRTALDMLR